MGNYLHSLRRRRRKRLADEHPELSDQRVAVIGLGRFGSSLAHELTRRGWDVLGIDTDAPLVQRHSDALTHSAVADCTDPEVLRQLGVHEFTSAVVGIGTDIEASMLITSNLLEGGGAQHLGQGDQPPARPDPRTARSPPCRPARARDG